MKITVKLSRTKETKEIHLETESTAHDLLRKMNLKPDTLIVMSDNVPIPIDIALKEFEAIILPITIRRTLPDGTFQDIPLKWLYN